MAVNGLWITLKRPTWCGVFALSRGRGNLFQIHTREGGSHADMDIHIQSINLLFAVLYVRHRIE